MQRALPATAAFFILGAQDWSQPSKSYMKLSSSDRPLKD